MMREITDLNEDVIGRLHDRDNRSGSSFVWAPLLAQNSCTFGVSAAALMCVAID